ncbi:MAG: hypothetical protein Q7S19_03675 [bacterium]|nr:hypothetical protein [bacterium]
MRDGLKNNLRLWLIGVICIIIFGYTLYEARFLIDGPELVIFSPKNHVTVTDSLLEIHGQVKNLSSLTINGRLIMIRPDGLFDDKLLLLDGYNTIEAKVKNKFGQETSKILEIMLVDPDII